MTQWTAADGIRYLTFDALTRAGLRHAVFTRQGGVSPEPWGSLNLGGTVGDEPERVAENRRLAFASVGRPLESLYDVWQVHGREVALAEAPRLLHQPHLKADAILTDRREVTLLMRFADCVPILLADPGRGIIGLVHAGWQGTVKGAAAAAVETMQSVFGCRPQDLLAAIGPSIGPDHYEVSADVIAEVRRAFDGAAAGLLRPSLDDDGKAYLDLWQANRRVLETAGVEQIEVAGICTACNRGDWYSHRAEHGRTGRFGALISLES